MEQEANSSMVVVVDIEEGVAACVVCLEPLEWVAAGRCGHRALCPKCMVSVRAAGNRRVCPVCHAWCPYVVVTKAGAWDASLLSRMPITTTEGHHGTYWYNRRTGAYFHDSHQYYAVSRATGNIPLPFYQPTVMFLAIYALALLVGHTLGHAFAREASHTWSKVMAYAICFSICLFMATAMWFGPRYCCDEDQPRRNAITEEKSGTQTTADLP